eukprot:3591877-Rhodomonas_salina.2
MTQTSLMRTDWDKVIFATSVECEVTVSTDTGRKRTVSASPLRALTEPLRYSQGALTSPYGALSPLRAQPLTSPYRWLLCPEDQ